MKIANKTLIWPVWLIVAIIAVSAFGLPVPTCRPLGQLEDRLCLVGYVLVVSRYLWSWKRGGALIDLVLYSIIGLLMPYVSILFVGVLSMVIER